MGFDEVNPTVSNDTTEVILNDGNPLTTPATANGLVEIIPVQWSQGAFTTEECTAEFITIDSDDVAVTPKLFSLPSIWGGGAVMEAITSPPLKAWALNIALAEQSRINYRANSQLALTVEVDVGATVVYTDSGVGPEQFYQKPANESNTVAAVDNRAVGNDITITGAREINKLYGVLYTNQTANDVTASVHSAGSFEFASSDFLTSMPYRVNAQPVLVGLGTPAIADVGPGIVEYDMPSPNGIPVSGRTVINTFFTNRDATTNVMNFITNVGYLK